MGLKYLCFTQDHNLESALLTFRVIYLVEPKEHKIEFNLLWLGPIPGSDVPMYATVEIPEQFVDRSQLVMF